MEAYLTLLLEEGGAGSVASASSGAVCAPMLQALGLLCAAGAKPRAGLLGPFLARCVQVGSLGLSAHLKHSFICCSSLK